MNKYKQLVKKYRHMFNNLPFGIECGPGWYGIIKDLCRKLELHLRADPELKKQFRVLQVKEKYGTLRFYTSVYNTRIEDMITEAEDLSEKTCEQCGKPGEMREVDGWYFVACDECANLRSSEIKDFARRRNK